MYFGKVPADRLVIKDGVMYFSADGQYLAVADPERALEGLGCETSRGLTAVRVGTYVNDVRHDDPACLRPDASGQLSLADF